MESRLEKEKFMSLSATPVTPSAMDTGGMIRSPELDKSGKPTQRALQDISQAKDIVNSLIAANSRRQKVNSRIMAKYNAERPYDQEKLKNEGLGWRSNFTTKPLPQMIEKVAPRFEEAVGGVKYLTNSAFPASVSNATMKTEVFRDKITSTIRTRKGWNELVSDIALDNALFGHTIVAWLDRLTWFPQHFAQDESFTPDGTKETSDCAQVVVVLEKYRPHEAYKYISDREAGEATGWNVENMIKVINHAAPDSLRDRLGTSGNAEAWYHHADRELTVGSSYMAGAKVINVYSLLIQEVTGKVSHYRLSSDGTPEAMLELFTDEDAYDSMEDAVRFFTFQKGNKTLHGSKGVGRDIYEMASMQDRMRNEVVDQGIMSGKMLVQGDFKMLHKFKVSVIGSTVIVPSGWTFLEQKVQGNIDSFLKLDAYFSQLVDQLIGSVSPRTFQGDRVTKAEVDLFASREEEGKDARISRFLNQFVGMISTMQKRLCDPDTADDDAKEMQKQILVHMTREELNFIAAQPVAGTVKDLTSTQRQMVAAFAAEKRGNPLYNQRALESEDTAARMGADFAKKVLIPEEDPTVVAESQRLQLLELNLLSTGQPVPVSPRDNHEIHLQVLFPAVEGLAENVMKGEAGIPVFEVALEHLTEHFNYATQAGVKKEVLKPVEDLIKQSGPALAQLKELDAQAQELSAQAGAPDAQAVPEVP
jgi:hypothetical protein